MEKICSDNMLQIYKLIPYHVKNLILSSKYFYNIFKNNKKNICTGNYILSSIQETMINDMITYTNTPHTEPLIVQSNISTGKTATILAFSMKYNGTVVIMVPRTILNHWLEETIKMYGKHDQIEIIHPQYDKIVYNQCSKHHFNPSSIGKKIIIISSSIKTNIHTITNHSLVIMDEVHKLGTKIYNNNKFIGLSASRTAWSHAHKKIYMHEEQLPSVKPYHMVINSLHINNAILKIKNRTQGPYLLLCHENLKPLINTKYIEYNCDSHHKMKKDDLLLLYPNKYATGTNLNYIQCIIFLYPINHLQETIIQSIGRVTRTTNYHKKISMYYIHHNQEEVIYCKSIVNENEILNFCHLHQLAMIKNRRDKNFLIDIIKQLLKIYSDDILVKINPLYYTCLLRIQKKDFDKINQLISHDLNCDIAIINNIIK